MKKLTAIVLSIVLLLSLACSCAEEQPAAGDFLQGVREWAAGLDLEKSDYKASIYSDGYQSAEIFVRKDQEITEIAVPGSGKIQISENAVVLDLDGQLYSMDLAAIREMYQTFFSEDRQVDKDMEMLRPWLEKAFRDIILPSVNISIGYSGLVLHIDAGSEEIRARTYAWIDEFMEDRAAIEMILKRYGLYLETIIPGMPQTYEELKKAWEAEKAYGGTAWPEFRITADITSSGNYYGRNISCAASLSFADVGAAKISFEFAATRDGFDLVSFLDVSEGNIYRSRRRYRSSSYEFDLHSHGGKVNGVLVTPEDTYTLEAEARTEEDYTTRITATINEKREHGEIMLDAVYDPGNSSLKAKLYNMNGSYDSNVPVELATLEAYMRSNGCDVSLSTDATRIAMHVSSDYLYRHVKINIDNTYNENYYLDFWMFRSEQGEIRVSLDSNFINRYMPHTYSLTVGRSGIAFSRTTGYGQYCDFSFAASWKQGVDGFMTEIEYLNQIESNPTFNTGNRPSTLKIIREGEQLTADLDWSMSGRQAFAVSFVPGTLTYTDGYAVYEFRITENTTEKLVISITKDHRQELGSIILTLKDGCLEGILTSDGEENLRIVIEPIEKKPIEAIRIL